MSRLLYERLGGTAPPAGYIKRTVWPPGPVSIDIEERPVLRYVYRGGAYGGRAIWVAGPFTSGPEHVVWFHGDLPNRLILAAIAAHRGDEQWVPSS